MIRSCPARCFSIIAVLIALAPVWAQTPPPAKDPDAPKAPEALSGDTYELVGQNPISHYDVLRNNLLKMVKNTRNPEAYGIYVEETNSPLVLIDHNGSSGYNPAEAQILLTSAAALELLGGKYRFRTTISPAGTLQNGVLQGHLIVRGTGDPTFGSTFFMEKSPKNFNAFETFEVWAQEVKKAGINAVAGSLLLDDTAFDDQLVAPDWPQDMNGHPVVAQVSALSFRDNCVDIFLDSGWRKRSKVEAEMFPGIYATLHSGVLASAKGTEPDVNVRRRGDSNIVEVIGTIPVRSEYRTRASIHNPTFYFGAILRKALIEEGVNVYRSKPRMIGDYKDDDALTSVGLPVVNHFSPHLSAIVPPMIRQQRFQTADQVFKALGYNRERKGSFKTGAQAVDYFFRLSSIEKGGSFVRDGSGRSRRNALSPKALAGTISYMNTHSDGSIFKSGLSRPGEKSSGPILESFGEVENLKENILAYEAEARTGLVLAGYVTTRGGLKLSFAFMCEDPRVSIRESQLLFAQLLNTLVNVQIESD